MVSRISDLTLLQISPQQEGTVVREGIDVVGLTDVGGTKFDAVVDVWVMFAAHEGGEGFGVVIGSLNLDGDE